MTDGAAQQLRPASCFRCMGEPTKPAVAQRDWASVFAVVFIGIACAAALGYLIFASPTKFIVAVGPRDGSEAKLLATFAEALRENRREVRLTLQLHDSVRESAQALEARRSDLAVVRPDIFLPTNGLTVAIMREEALIVAAPTVANVKEFGDLARKRLGVVAHHEADLPAIEMILSHYDLLAPNLTVVLIAPEEVEVAFREKRIEALAFLAAAVSPEASQLVRAMARVVGDKISIVGIGEADTLALKSPALTGATIPAGALVGRPKLPKEDVKTVAVSYRLMARNNLDRLPVSRVTEQLFKMRSRLARTNPAAHLLEAPEKEGGTSAVLPNHRGALDYYNREEWTLMYRYGDWMWLALFASGSVSSAMAWAVQRFRRRRRERVDEVLERLADVLNEARSARSTAELDAMTGEVDALVTVSLQHAHHRTTAARVMMALMLAIDSARTAVADRRRELRSSSAAKQFR